MRLKNKLTNLEIGLESFIVRRNGIPSNNDPNNHRYAIIQNRSMLMLLGRGPIMNGLEDINVLNHNAINFSTLQKLLEKFLPMTKCTVLSRHYFCHT